jgi:anti-anti-sigma regulatory factor
MRQLEGVVVLDIMPRHTVPCDLTRALSNWELSFSGNPHVVVNLSQVEVADSTFLAGLALLKKKIDAARGKLILYGSRSLLGEIFACTNLRAFFVIVASELDVMRLLERGKAGRR